MKLHPYLNFNGNCRSAFEFYEKNLGGKILATMTHSEAPPGLKVPPEWNSAILYARMTFSPCFRKAEKFLCHYRKRSGLSALPRCETSSARFG